MASEKTKHPVGRRAFLGGAAGAVAIASVDVRGALASAGTRGEVAPFFDGLPERLGAWRVVQVHDVHLGGVPVILETESGERFQVDVLRRGQTASVCDTESASLFLANRGDGSLATREDQGQGLLALGAWIREREQRATLPALLTIEQRLQTHPNGAFFVA